MTLNFKTTSALQLHLADRPGETPPPPPQLNDVLGIGPVISGWQDDRPCYWFDLLLAGGIIERRIWWKSSRGADKKAKADAVFERSRLVQEIRECYCVVVVHDECSFDGFVQWVRHHALAPATTRRRGAA